MKNKSGLISFWNKHNETIVLVMLTLIFFAFSLFIAFNLKPGIIPDEPAHFQFSKHFSSTPWIPTDIYETYTLGWYIEQNPFLYHWINGRIINLINLVSPDATDWAVLVSLRVFSGFYAVGTIVYCYYLSQEVIKQRWWRLLPVFFLSNTLMFVFLSGGVNYDNLANFFSMAGLFFLVRVLNKKHYLINSLLWMILIALGCLVKYPILPLALAMLIVWLVFSIKSRPTILSSQTIGVKTICLAILLLVLLYGNFAIYGVNLIRYQSLTPSCREIHLETQCQLSPFERRHEALALDRKMTISESIERGYPNPIRYAGNVWIEIMIVRTFGIAGHLSYKPVQIVNFFRFMVYGTIILSLIFIKRYAFTTYSLMGIVLFYSATLLYQNYTSELVYGFLHIAFQGRYIFPVIGAIYTLLPTVWLATNNKYIHLGALTYSIGLFFAGGPIVLLLSYGEHFTDWFIL